VSLSTVISPSNVTPGDVSGTRSKKRNTPTRLVGMAGPRDGDDTHPMEMPISGIAATQKGLKRMGVVLLENELRPDSLKYASSRPSRT
jgi:hypothetical protein